MNDNIKFLFNILITEEDKLYVAHCLELDIVVAANTETQVKQDILDLIRAQVRYAIEHNNFAYLYHPAPQEVWERFLACQQTKQELFHIPYPGFIANTAMVGCHA